MKRALKWVWRVFLGYCVVLAVMRGLFAWPYARSAGDWVRYLASMTEDSTLYSEGYDEKAFRSLRAGMTAGEVEEVLGKPLWRRDGGEGREVWAYSSTRGEGCVTCPDGFFWMRRVVFGPDGKVLETESAYWDD